MLHFIANRDIFGYKFKLKYDKKEGAYVTFVGGVCSIVLYGFMLFFLITKIILLFSGEEDQIRHEILGNMALELTNQTGANGLNMLIMTYLFYTQEDGTVRHLNVSNSQQYFSLYFGQRNIDYTNSSSITWFEDIGFEPAEDCKYPKNKSDFSNHFVVKKGDKKIQLQKTIENWKDRYPLFCQKLGTNYQIEHSDEDWV